MRAYFVGCSHTYGDDLEDPINQAWPAILSRRLGYQFVNDAVPGGTNERILYRVIKHIDQFDYFYIAWTYTSRFTRYRSDNNHDVNYNPGLRHSLYGNDHDFLTYGRIHYALYHNELYAFKLWLQQILCLQSILVSHGKCYTMLNAVDNLVTRWCVPRNQFNDSIRDLVCFDLMDNQQLADEHGEIMQLVRKIDQTQFLGWPDRWLMQLKKQYAVGATGHLLADGHQACADWILNQ